MGSASPILVSDGYTTAKMRQIATGALILCVVAATVSFPQGPPSYPFSPYAHAGAQPNQWSSVNVLAGLLQSGAIPGAFPAFGNYGAQPGLPSKQTGPAVPVGPAGPAVPAGSGAAGMGSGTSNNGNSVATGVAQVNTPPGGFGIALGIGTVVSTPFGNIAIGQGHGTAVG